MCRLIEPWVTYSSQDKYWNSPNNITRPSSTTIAPISVQKRKDWDYLKKKNLLKPLIYFHRANITSIINYINITNITNRELKLEITQLVIKLPIGDFEFGFGVCRIGIGDLG